MVVVESAGITDVGRKRKGNEDSLFLDDTMSLYVVADGMGGHVAGEVASRLTVETIESYIKRFNGSIDVEEMEDIDQTLSQYANRLLSGIHLANRGVHQVASSQDAYRGMGTTVSAIYFTDKTLVAANVGDSPIYLVHGGDIEIISILHTVMAEHAAIDPKEAKQLSGKLNHMLTRAIGTQKTVKPDICEIQCFKDDVLVISSDGLSDKVSPEEILDVVNRNHTSFKTCQTLVDMANERGGDDNTTVIVLKIKKVYDSSKITGTIMGNISKIASAVRRFSYKNV
jgi:serine/threonine protein phosphatase PrpC